MQEGKIIVELDAVHLFFRFGVCGIVFVTGHQCQQQQAGKHKSVQHVDKIDSVIVFAWEVRGKVLIKSVIEKTVKPLKQLITHIS